MPLTKLNNMETPTKTAKELGLIPKYEPMTPEQTKMLTRVLIGTPVENIEMPFVIRILEKRIEVMQLPIKFTVKGKFAALTLSEGNPGKMMTILIDCLTKYEGQEVDGGMICDIYPIGFYSENSFMDYVDNYIKTRQVKWSQIY